MSKSQRKLYVARYSTGEGVIGGYLFWSDGHFLDENLALVDGLPLGDLFGPAGGDLLTVDQVETSLGSIPFISAAEPEPTFETDVYGTQQWRDKRGRLHRLEGPAVIYPNGYQAWYKDGKHHREEGRAISYTDGSGTYWLEGRLVTDPDQIARIEARNKA